ncbi:MAG: helix-turn-helix domain-containing protein [Limimaricola soesokkakensis]|uniref:helix-turn-helix domain-containing protein n=1 Tax=Limimaricola soesokkakensis TaxID=1343159 RepID=UPI004058A51E
MVVVAQLRAARAALRWTLQDLARLSGISVRTLKTIESQNGVPQCRQATLEKLIHTLEAAGVEFLNSPESYPGIRMPSPSQE